MFPALSKLPLPLVVDCAICELPKINDPRGNLTFIEQSEAFPFPIQRVFYLYDVPKGGSRAGHALKTCHQMLVAISGSFEVVVRDGLGERRVRLDSAARGYHIPPMIWREVEQFSDSAVCLVLASEEYSEAGYVREWPDYQTYRHKENQAELPIVRSWNSEASYEKCRVELDAAYRRFMTSNQLVLGNEVMYFEKEYSAYCEAQYCVGLGHGLDALVLALKVLDIGPGDEVIVPANTYIASWLAVSQIGASIVPVEPDANTFNMDVSLIEAAITSRTKAILAVNLYGLPCDYDGISAICRLHGLRFLVDNAQGHGAKFREKRVGGLADIECHSFYPTKNLGAYGEAGAITTNQPEWADRVRVLRNYGSRNRYENEVCGYNSRLDELQAAFLRVKLRKLDGWNDLRRKLAAFYQKELETIPELKIPRIIPELEPVWHQFVIRHPKRDDLQKHLTKHGIETIIHYPIPPHRSQAYEDLKYNEGTFPLTEQLARESLSLPMGPHITLASAARVVDAVRSFFT